MPSLFVVKGTLTRTVTLDLPIIYLCQLKCCNYLSTKIFVLLVQKVNTKHQQKKPTSVGLHFKVSYLSFGFDKKIALEGIVLMQPRF